MSPIDPFRFVTDYEALRAAFLAARASQVVGLSIQRLIGEGLHAWLMPQPPACPDQVPRPLPPASLPYLVAVPDDEAFVQLMVSMTLGSVEFAQERA